MHKKRHDNELPSPCLKSRQHLPILFPLSSSTPSILQECFKGNPKLHVILRYNVPFSNFIFSFLSLSISNLFNFVEILLFTLK